MKARIALAAAVAVAAGVPVASANRQTTRPNILYTIPAVLSDTAIKLTHTRLPRGTMIRYAIINQGSRTYAFQIGKRQSPPIPPKGRAVIRVNWDYRGRFTYRTLYRGRSAGPHGTITVF